MRNENTLTPPSTVAWLGYGGALPFLLLATATLLDDAHARNWLEALYEYGAVILSFVGALHWGIAMSLHGMTERQRSASFLWSVIPALMGWIALLVSPALAAPILVLGFVLHYGMDLRLARQAVLPCWYLTLRLRLSCTASFCLLGTALAASRG